MWNKWRPVVFGVLALVAMLTTLGEVGANPCSYVVTVLDPCGTAVNDVSTIQVTYSTPTGTTTSNVTNLTQSGDQYTFSVSPPSGTVACTLTFTRTGGTTVVQSLNGTAARKQTFTITLGGS